jgi:hypothetical protein
MEQQDIVTALARLASAPHNPLLPAPEPVERNEAAEDACPPPLSPDLWEPVRTMLRRDVGIDSTCGTATLMLMGLVEPVRILEVTGRRVRYTFDGTLFGVGETSAEYDFSAVVSAEVSAVVSAEFTAMEHDVLACLAPAYAASQRGCRVIVHESLRRAWAGRHAGLTLVEVRLARSRLNMHIPSLAHIPLVQGSTLEDWVRLSASADDALLASSVMLTQAVDSVRRRLEAVCEDLVCIDDMVHRHKRLALNAWRLL